MFCLSIIIFIVLEKAKFKEAVDDYHAKFEFVDLRRPMSSSGPFYCFDYHS